jgi:type IV secretion system protein VirB10
MAVRVRKAVGIIALLALGVFAAAIVLGIYLRQHQQVQASSKADTERKAFPATSAGAEITSQIPPGNAPVTKQSVVSLDDQDNHSLFGRDNTVPAPPHRGPAGPAPRIHPAAAPSLPVQSQSSLESAEEREREIAYQREQEAIDAPTGIAGGGRGYSGNTNTLYAGGAPQSSSAIRQTLNGSGAGSGLPGISTWNSGTGSAAMSQATEYRAQNGQDDKAVFISQARNRMAENYLKSVRTPPLSKFEIKAGWDIMRTLEQAINSDQPGEIKALVRENVYDTATGKYCLLPQGSRLVGSYNSVITYGQDGIQAVWDRVIFPDGSSLNLGGMIGQDAKGQSGLRYSVNHHYGRLLGFAVLTSLFSAGFQLSQNRPGSILTQPNAGQVVAGAVGQEVSQLGVEITRRNLNVQPTIKVPAGYRFNVRVNRDIVFDAPYSPVR